jgi:protein-S-isoprenylcysteine O-methyltransferase Ste14
MAWNEAVVRVAAIFVGFAVLHSLFVTGPVKALWCRIFGERLTKAYYRLLYTLSNTALAGAAFVLLLLVPDETLYVPPLWTRIPLHAVQLAGLMMGVLAFRPFDPLEFMGVRQAWRHIRRGETGGDIEGLSLGGLVTTGVYGIVRHPMYLGGILLFVFNPHVTRTWLTVSVLAVCYFVYGSVVEDRRLVRHFGDEYRKYRERVPLLVPRPGDIIRLLVGRRGSVA